MPSFADRLDNRRRPLAWVFGCALLASCLGVWAQGYPAKPVRMVVPFPPGGFADVTARIVAQAFTERLGQSFIIENKPGASTLIGAESVAKSAPDGYTLLYAGSSTFTVNPVLLKKLPYDPLKSFAPIGIVSRTAMLLLAHPSAPANNLKELAALAAAKPGHYAYGSFGNGTISNFGGEQLASALGVKLLHVPYRGSSPLMNALVAGEVPFSVDTLVVAAPQIRAGRIKAIAVTAARRTSLLPDVPTVAESGYPGFDVSAWSALSAPAATPEAVIRRLRDVLNRITATKDVIDRFAAIGVEPVVADPDDFVRVVRQDIRNFTRIAKEANIQAE